MDEPTITKNSGEMAEFSDGSSILRQRVGLNAEFAQIFSGMIPVQAFKLVLKEGITLTEAKARWADPTLRAGEEGVPIGSIFPSKTQMSVGDKGFGKGRLRNS
jgi:hypothetical protein